MHDQRLGSAARLSIEQQPLREDLPPQGPFRYYSDAKFISVPYPSWVRLEPTISPLRTASAASLPWQSRHSRPLLVAACFGIRNAKHPLARLRSTLHAQCTAAAATTCTFLPPHSERGLASSVVALYRRATFCLQPSGDSVTRKGILDAILLGCIPVIFHRSVTMQWAWHWGAWVQNASVLIPEGDLTSNRTDAITYLAALTPSQVQAMRDTLAGRAHTMHYFRTPPEAAASRASAAPVSAPAHLEEAVSSDAFVTTLRGVRTRANDSALVDAGRAIQQTSPKYERLFEAFANLTHKVSATDGFCFGATGDAALCADTVVVRNQSWKSMPPKRMRLEQCINYCNGCERCRFVSYSFFMGACAWHHTCNFSRLYQRWEFWTYRSFYVAKANGTGAVAPKPPRRHRG